MMFARLSAKKYLFLQTSGLSATRSGAVPQYSGNSHFTSTPAIATNPLPGYDSSASLTQHRSPPGMYHPSGNLHLQRSPLQDRYNDFPYHERPFDSSRLHEDGVLHSRYPQQTDGRWQPSSFHDNQGTYQTQFVPSSREFDAFYHRPPDRYPSPPDQVFYDGRQPVGEGPRSYAPDTRYRSAEVPYGQRQGPGTATPYEPRTELQRGYQARGGERGLFDQSRHGGQHYDGWQARYHGNQRSPEFEPQRNERNIGGRDETLVDKVWGLV